MGMFPDWLGSIGAGTTEIKIVKEYIEVGGNFGAIPRIIVRAKVKINNKKSIKVKLKNKDNIL